ncbi:ISNCY family transposase [Ketobacter sp.]|uniref:ISNCY family transposase n=1 Tax=Ketobacter sp. TaxID=2083498 RepID=UPI000F12CDCA|nr:ISNCY family transposase [Ketobacter sp.]RLT95617.1 MAG: ISNCY family transposase [Ketobacter sp.]
MTEPELSKFQVIQQLSEGKLTRRQAGELLHLSIRQIQRLHNRYRNQGIAGLVSQKRGQPSNRSYPDAFKQYVLYLVKAQYTDFGPTLACEKLAELHNLHVSVSTLRSWMVEAEIWTTRKAAAKRVYQPRYRRECFGELIQIDGSDHYWFEDRVPKCTLLVFIDDATSQLMELRFCPSETTFDYFQATKRYLETYGKPVAFYSDKHSIFRVNKPDPTTGSGMTQFGRALQDLNIDIICANTSQAKGRVERANRTLQDRLVKELRLRDISDIDAGNQYLPEFRQAFNQRFAKVPFNDKDLHRPLNQFDDLEDALTWQVERTVSNSLTVQYDRVVYLLEPNDLTLGLKRKKVRIYDYPDGTIEIRYDGHPLPYSIFDKVQEITPTEIVNNKRLGVVLQYAQEKQKEIGYKRSQHAPSRKGQAHEARKLNPAARQTGPT